MGASCVMGKDIEHPAYKTGLLNPDKHYMLVRDLRKYSEVAGISEKYIYTSLSNHCSETEIKWMQNFHSYHASETHGMIYSGQFKESIFQKMATLTGCFLRNFVDARIIMLSDVIKSIYDNSFDPTVLMIPNFYMNGTERGGVKLFDRDRQNLFGFMMDRSNRGKCTILYVENMDKMAIDYGEGFVKLFKNYHVYTASDLK